MKQLVFEKLWGNFLSSELISLILVPVHKCQFSKKLFPLPTLLPGLLIKGVKFHKPLGKHHEISFCALQLVFFVDVYFHN